MAKPLFQITTIDGLVYRFTPTNAFANVEALAIASHQRGGLVGSFEEARASEGPRSFGPPTDRCIPWHMVADITGQSVRRNRDDD